MTDLPILYSFRRCPYAMRARMGLLVSGIVCEIREVSLKNKPAEMLEKSPKGTVPVLVLPDGQVIDESIDIMRWALGRSDGEDWLGGGGEALIERNDGPFKHHLDRYKYPNRYDSDPLEHRAAALVILQDLEARLQGHANLCRETRALADMAIMPFVRQFANTDRAWFDRQDLPRLQDWLARHLASPLFERAMRRLDIWAPGDGPILFPAV